MKTVWSSDGGQSTGAQGQKEERTQNDDTRTQLCGLLPLPRLLLTDPLNRPLTHGSAEKTLKSLESMENGWTETKKKVWIDTVHMRVSFKSEV